LKGRGGKGRGAKPLITPLFAFPQIGGIWRGGEVDYYIFNYINTITLNFILKSKIILIKILNIELSFFSFKKNYLMLMLY
jgi:hypothetical protein